MNAFDRIISFFNPEAGLRRQQARTAADVLRKYEAGSTSSRTSGWVTQSTDANAELLADLPRIRNRSRDLVRNNPYAFKAVEVIENNVVGTGIRATILAGGKRAQAAANTRWLQWAESTACDFDGLHDFYGLQGLVMRTVAESGEALVIRRYVDGVLKLQVIEGDQLDTYQERLLGNGNRVIQGVEFDKRNRRVAYWLYPDHPGGTRMTLRLNPERVPAADVLHIYRVLRPGQVRGVPAGVSAFIRLKDLDEYEDAELMRKKIASCYTAFVTDAGDAITNAAGTDKERIPSRIRPGMIEVLPPGKSVELSNPPTVEGYAEYMQVSLHAVAAAWNVTYESLTGDLKGVNFSSGRMGWIEAQKNFDKLQWRMLIPQFCAGSFGWFANWVNLTAGDVGLAAKWTPPRREMIDPSKEIAALENEVRAGFKTLPEAITEMGYDPDQVLAEIASTNALLDRLNLKLTTDPRYFSQAGKQPQENSVDTSQNN